MKAEQSYDNTGYCSPACDLMEINHEGIVCASQTGKNEDFDDWNYYDNEGWH